MNYTKSRAAHALLLIALATGFGSDARANRDNKSETYADRPQAQAFAEEMAGRGLDAGWVRQTLSEAMRLESVRRAMKPLAAGQRKNWQAYRARFVDAQRTDAGRAFVLEHAEALARASNQFGVPVEVIVGIIGVETFYGRNTGRFRVVDALATLAFDYPLEEGRDRSGYFREQLGHFFIWCAKERCDPLSIKGSYAGAMGIPQFMPENIHRYGADTDGDGKIDLNNPVDAIGSVARFLAKHGWVRQLDPVFPVDVEEAQLEPLLAPDILPTFTPERLAAHGAQPLAALPQREAYALVELQNGEVDSEYVLGSRNFFVLTRYNRSSYYAMAVLHLGCAVVAEEAVAQALDSQTQSIGANTGCSAC
jgi:membrane-bound lytic murein transglycosylase B